jgi:hypothetical protein
MCYFLSLNIVGVVSSALKGEGIYIPISRGLALEIIVISSWFFLACRYMP